MHITDVFKVFLALVLVMQAGELRLILLKASLV